MTKIVHEIPDELELELEGEEVEVSLDEGKAAKPGKSTADVERVVHGKSGQPEFDFEIEEEDDTPLEDRGKAPLPDDIVEQLENDTLEDYSERVKQRMAQLKKVYHDERRAKESAGQRAGRSYSFCEKYCRGKQKAKNYS
jgi:hypothetical protein